jgi:hypothetical protein
MSDLQLSDDDMKSISHLPRSKKQKTCKHTWEYVMGDIGFSKMICRIFCTKCKFHFQKFAEQVWQWGPWEKLPDIGPKFVKYVEEGRVVILEWDKH